MLARRFLWIVVGLIILVALAALGYRLFGDRLIAIATEPKGSFAQSPQSPAPDYADGLAWVARPGRALDPGLFAPPGFRPAPKPAVAVFYVPPTTYIKNDRWNANLDDPDFQNRARALTAVQGGVFNNVGAVWAPFYRQASFGAFLSRKAGDKVQAFNFAYADVVRAWDAFLAANPSGPIILGGHSQGSMHLARLIAERVAKDPALKERVVAAYVGGWPLSVTADLPAMGMEGCAAPDTTGCVISWQSFAEPADTRAPAGAYATFTGLTGKPTAGTPILCVNPIRGFRTDAAAVAGANLGALKPNPDDPLRPKIVAGAVGAHCVGGFLMIGPPPPGFDKFVLPGNNYHVYDYHLFWANLRADAERRANAWMSARLPKGALPAAP